MLEARNYDGHIAFLLGIIVLFLAGIGMVMVADDVTRSGRSRSETLVEIEEQARRLSVLQDDLMTRRIQLKDTQAAVVRNAQEERMYGLSHAHVQSRRYDLLQLRERLQASVGQIEVSYARYRRETRERAWLEAIGSSLGRLQTKEGEVFDDVLLVAVDEEGISIRHSGGTSYVPSASLSESLSKRFLWEHVRKDCCTERHTHSP